MYRNKSQERKTAQKKKIRRLFVGCQKMSLMCSTNVFQPLSEQLSNGYWILLKKKKKIKERNIFRLGSDMANRRCRWLLHKDIFKKSRDNCQCNIFYAENVTREWQRLIIWTRPAE